MQYFFWVAATDSHDAELEIIESSGLEAAKAEFAGLHPEDIDNIESISLENEFVPLWQKGR